MRRSLSSSLWVFLALTFLAGVMTYPLLLLLPGGLNDFGDPLLNAWILAWDLHAIRTDLAHLFDANIFHPYPLTLAYSEHLLPQSLMAAPVLMLGGNPILAHNLLLFSSFPLAGLGMYLLARRLTGDHWGAVLAALLYAFAPYRMAHLGHLQLLTIQWLPLALLFLHRVVEGGGRWRDLVGFGAFFLLQALSAVYYAYFLTFAVALFLCWTFLPASRPPLWPLAGRLALTTLVAAALLLPFSLPYRAVQRQFGFSRSLEEIGRFSALPESYLAAPSANWIYGGITSRFRRPEGTLFLGVVPLSLAVAALARRRRPEEAEGDTHVEQYSPLEKVADGAIAAYGILAAVKLGLVGGHALRIGSLKVHLPPFVISFLLLAGAMALRRRLNGRTRPLWVSHLLSRLLPWPPAVGFYLSLTLLAVLLSLGPTVRAFGWEAEGVLYKKLYRSLPGFDALRVPARFAFLALTGGAVLAAHGAAGLGRRRWSLGGRVLLLGGLAALILAEAWSVPLRLRPFPPEPPPVYRWLAAQPGDFAVVELPISGPRAPHREAHRLYYSTFHWKRLFNGYSGLFPPDYWANVETLQGFPSQESVALLRRLGVRYVIVHAAGFPADHLARMAARFGHYPALLRAVAEVDGAFVIEVAGES